MTTYYSSFYPIESADGAKGSAAFLGAITTTIIYLYKRSATALSDSDKPNGNVIYTFATADINSTAVTNGWYESVPSGSDPLYIVAATATGINPTDTIASNEWTSPVIFSQSGLSTATVFLFQRSNSPTLPAVPSGSTTYTFSSGILSGNLYGWSQTAPDTALGKYLFATTATAISSSSTDTIANTEWASVVVLTVNGENGQDGQDGTSGLTVFLTNESHTVPASYTGVVSSYSGASGQFKIYDQNVGDVSSSFTINPTPVSNPQGLTYTFSGTSYSITGGMDVSEDIATITMRVVGSGAYTNISIDKVFTLAKSKSGQDGSSPKLLSITADRQVINYSGTGALNPATQTTAFTAYKQNTTNAVSWTIKDTLGNTLTPVTTYLFSGTGDTNSMTAAQFSAAISVNGARGVVVTATLTDGTTFTDSITVVKVVDGTNGTNGTSPLVYDIITSSPVIVKDAPDAATTGTYSSITIQGRKYDGNTTSNYGWITVTANGDTEATTATDTATTPITLSPASNSGKSSYTVKLYNQATVSGATLLDTQSITVVFKGASGTNGTNARAVSLSTNTQAFAYDSTGANPSPANTVITATALNTSGTVYYEFILDGTSVQNTTTNTYTYTPQASFSNMPDTVRVNIREGTSTSTILASDMIAMSGLKNTVNGTDGLAALTPVISNSAHTLPTTNTGTVTYTGSGTTIRLYEGTTELTYDGVGTSNGTWKIVATPTNITTGTLTDSGTFVTVGDHSAMTANTASISYAITGKRAGGGSISLTLFQTFSKSIQGDNGSNGANGLAVVLSNESHVFPANNAGAVSSYTGSGTVIRLYEGATELVYDGTGTANGTWTVSSAATNITRGSLTDSGNYVTVGDHSGVADGTDTSSIVYTITGKTSTGAAINLTKTQSFSKAKTGANGSPGSPGAAAVSGYLTSESSVVFTYADGTPTNFNGVNGFLKIIQGTTDVTATATSFSATASGCTGTINTADNTPVNGQIKGYYQVTAMSADSATLTLSATFGGTTITKTFTVTKSKAGYEIVSILPTANLFQGRVVFLTTDNKLYRYNGTTWVKEVAAADISGTLADAQIAAVAASKVTGQLTNAQIASIDAATKLTGVVPIANIPTIPTTNLSGTIGTTQIADDAITTAKIAANAITAAEIAADTITSGQIAANAITANELAANSVTAGKIAAGSITATEIAANTITAAKLVAGTITANEIAANTITAAKIAAGTITAAEIAAGTITAAKIAADTITANQIAANAITASEIATDAITADKISAGSITAAKLAATNVITLSAQIQDAIITTAKIGDLQVNNAKIANLTVGTQKIEDLAISRSSSSYYNFNGYSYTTDGVWYDLFVTQGGYVYVGSGNGSYNYTQTGTGTYGEPIYSYTYVGPGLGDYNYVTSQFGLYTSVTTGSAAQSGTQVVNIEAVVVIARDGGSDDNVKARVIRTNDNQELPESYSTLRARSGPSTYALMFRDPFPIAGVANNYKVQLMNLSDNSHIYEASMRATLFRK